MTKDIIQLEAIKEWAKTKKGTIVLPTGTGKTAVAVHVVGRQLQANKIPDALVVVPKIMLIDQWREEFKKWGYSSEKVEIVCVNSAYKLKEKYGIVVLDEIHTCLSPVFRAIFDNVQYTQLMGLTATIPEDEEYQKLLDKKCPVVFHRVLKDIEKTEIVSDYLILNLPVPLNRKDSAKYRTFNSMFLQAQLQVGIAKKNTEEYKGMNIFDVAKILTKDKKDTSDLAKKARQYWSAMTMRKQICYNSQSKIEFARDIVQMYPNKKWILFNKSIKAAEALATLLGEKAIVYHSKLDDEQRVKALEDFSNNTYKYLCAVDALNAGLNVPDADGAICVSGVSTELVSTQQLGRIIRYQKGKKAIFINLYSENTVEQSWVDKKTKNLPNSFWINAKQLNKWMTTEGTT